MRPITDEVRKWKLVGMGAIGIAGVAFGISFADALRRIIGVIIGR